MWLQNCILVWKFANKMFSALCTKMYNENVWVLNISSQIKVNFRLDWNKYEEVRRKYGESTEKKWWHKNQHLKGVTGNIWWLNWVCTVVDNLFWIHLRHIKRFHDVSLRSLSAKLSFKIMTLGVYVFRIGFFKLLNNDDEK